MRQNPRDIFARYRKLRVNFATDAGRELIEADQVVDAFDQALGSVMKQLVNWTLRTPPPRPPSDSAPYDINRYRNPANAVINSANCPKGNDASMVPLTDE